MVWVRLDDGFTDNPKIAALSDAAFRSFITALCYCNKNLTDGLVPALIAKQVAAPRVLIELTTAVIFERVGANYRVHDYDQYQPSKADVETKQTASKLLSKDEANLYPVPDPVPKDVSLTPLPPVERARLERLHEQMRVRVFGGANAPDGGWCEDLIRRGATDTDIEAAVDGTATRQIKGRGAFGYARSIIERRVQERAAGNDPDIERGAGDARSRGDGPARQTQRGGFRAVGQGRDPGSRAAGFDGTGLPPAIGDVDPPEWREDAPSNTAAASPVVRLRSVP